MSGNKIRVPVLSEKNLLSLNILWKLNELNKLSVIVMAHDRKQYIKNAVDSVLKQTLQRELYEIIIVKSFKDSDIDEYIDQNCERNIYTEEKPVSCKIKEGATSATYDIVALLDDDDQFSENKLKMIYDSFCNDSSLVYFHNRSKMVDSEGKFLKFGGAAPDFNLSSIAFRKSAINLDMIGKLSIGLDTFIYTACLDSGKAMVLNDDLLTIYTFHESVSVFRGTFEEAMSFNCKTALSFISSLDIFMKYAKREEVKNILITSRTKFNLNYSIYETIRSGKRVKGVKFSNVLKFLFTKTRLSLPFKTRLIKVAEYYFPKGITLWVEKRRFKSGSRPT